LPAFSVGNFDRLPTGGNLIRDERLKLAREKQQDLVQKVAVVTTEGLDSQHQLALHDKGFTQFAALQSSVRSTIAAIKE
jgi:hypothetical protein